MSEGSHTPEEHIIKGALDPHRTFEAFLNPNARGIVAVRSCRPLDAPARVKLKPLVAEGFVPFGDDGPLTEISNNSPERPDWLRNCVAEIQKFQEAAVLREHEKITERELEAIRQKLDDALKANGFEGQFIERKALIQKLHEEALHPPAPIVKAEPVINQTSAAKGNSESGDTEIKENSSHKPKHAARPLTDVQLKYLIQKLEREHAKVYKPAFATFIHSYANANDTERNNLRHGLSVALLSGNVSEDVIKQITDELISRAIIKVQTIK